MKRPAVLRRLKALEEAGLIEWSGKSKKDPRGIVEGPGRDDSDEASDCEQPSDLRFLASSNVSSDP